MTALRVEKSGILFLAIPSLLFFVAVLFLRSSLYISQPDSLGIAVSLDLLITIPAVYFLLIRRSKVPYTTVVPVMMCGFLIGSLFLPEDQQGLLNLFQSYAFPAIEMGILIFALLKVRKAVRLYSEAKGISTDFYTILRKTCCEMVPRAMVMPLATEISIIYYGFIKWGSRRLAENEFSYHKKSGTPALLVGLMFIIGAEAFAMHFVLALWSGVAAWVLTILSTYTVLQFFGFMKSLAQRPIILGEEAIAFRYGIMGEAVVRYDQILKFEKSRKSVKDKDGYEKLSPLGDLDVHNLLIHFQDEIEKEGLYGMKKTCKVLAVYVDEVDKFKNEVEKRLSV